MSNTVKRALLKGRCGMGSSWPGTCDRGSYILFNFTISDPD